MVVVMADTVVTIVANIHLTPQNQVAVNLVQKVHPQLLNQEILIQNQVPIQVNTVYYMVVVNQPLHEMHFEQVQMEPLYLVGSHLIVKQNPSQILQQMFHHYTVVGL